LEPLAGLDVMRVRRSGSQPAEAPIRDRDLTRGPGRLTVALGIGIEHDGLDLFARASPLWLADDGARPEVGTSVRIGLGKGAEREQRFYARGSAWLSGRRGLSP
ncbi:MAG: DNA-3-methyladenine glycosylase, partial [Candidatus Eremiobacteraeota bacterium]|nr:DNA-3-methyladenine glycosylase [Candidatus Eremiobacteraeota bacterium]